MEKDADSWLKQAQSYQPELLTNLKKYLAIPSVYDPKTVTEKTPLGKGIDQALTFLEDLARQDGFRVRRCAKGMVSVISFGPEDAKETIGVLVHADVVPAGSGWTVTGAFEPKEINGRLYGRGAHDMKADVMASYYAIRQLADDGLQPNRRIDLIVGGDEESQWRDMRAYLAENEAPTMAFSPDGAFPVVPGELGVVTMQLHVPAAKNQGSWRLLSFDAGIRDNVVPGQALAKLQVANDEEATLEAAYQAYLSQYVAINGTMQKDGNVVTLKLNGIAAHGAYPDQGMNAATFLAHFLMNYAFDTESQKFLQLIGDRLHENFEAQNLGIDYRDPIMGGLVLNLSQVHYQEEKGGDINLRFRFPKGIEISSVAKDLQDNLGEYDAKVSYDPDKVSPAHFVPLDDEIVKTLGQVYADHTNSEKTYKIASGGSYARIIKRGVAFGGQFPDAPMNSHQPNEFVIVANIPRAQAIFADALARLAML
ncbi:dipeptidase PepV [Eupransor demetentiae]|uniref:Acetylornithine deacetylase/Succinyl-diaminopimelate desuccinylase or related deacylase (ArgE) n=1 Tax=Eupransor demetentiae TaxID=3109584 RepID=A0ABP0ETT9_9LACO|nr:Acetylornithine deacetylase/Succinyl-diaminopimelate desuccinylase or related deacylase (ArgE) [Lactobacillaceae bacterium LMG 33000]